MTTESKLLRGGTVLSHTPNDHVLPIKADLLIEGNVITKIEDNIQPPESCEVIDCTGKIICPGFINTHHHVWLTLLKGRYINQLLPDDFGPAHSLHSASDLYWGELAGCLECLDVGTTTVVDHAHLNYSPEHSNAAIAATVSSGIRSVFCYCPTHTVDSREPVSKASNFLPDWVTEHLESLAAKAPFGNGRVTLGFAFDGFNWPKEVVVPIFHKIKSLGVKTWTCHYRHGPIQGFSSFPEMLDDYGILDSSALLSSASNAAARDAALLRQKNSFISTSPSTELQMDHGGLAAVWSDSNLQSHISLGVDCHRNNSASMVSEMRLLLQSARSLENEKLSEKGLNGKNVDKKVEEVFNLGTINGARAINMEGKIGSLAVGKLADILIFDALSPSMVGGAQYDPVATIVLRSSPADIEMVIVDGVVRKRYWMLEGVETKPGKEIWDGEKRENLAWSDVAKELIERRKLI